MTAVTVEPDHRVGMDSFQYRTFRCGSCGDTERCFAFNPDPRDQLTMRGPTAPESIVPAESIEPESIAPAESIVPAESIEPESIAPAESIVPAASIAPGRSAQGEIQSRMARIADALSMPLARLFNK
jgi:hypothetical protein